MHTVNSHFNGNYRIIFYYLKAFFTLCCCCFVSFFFSIFLGVRVWEGIHTISIQTKVLSLLNLVTYFLIHLQPSPPPNSTPKKRYTSLLVFREAPWPSGRASDSGARGRGFEPQSGRRVVSLSKIHLPPKKYW